MKTEAYIYICIYSSDQSDFDERINYECTSLRRQKMTNRKPDLYGLQRSYIRPEK